MISDFKNLMDLTGKRALVTGGAQGFGRIIAETYLAHGAVVTLLDINGEHARETAEELRAQGGTVYSVQADTSVEAEVEAAFAEAIALMGGLDICVAVAGISGRAPTEEMSLELWQKVIDVDLTGVFLCDRAAGRHMLEHGGGSIINMASIIGLVGNKTGNSNYAAAKGGVVAMTRVMAVEWAQRGVRVNAIAPAQTDGPFIKQLMEDNPDVRDYFLNHIPMGRLEQPKEVAGLALYLASDSASFMTGQTIAVDGGVTCAF